MFRPAEDTVDGVDIRRILGLCGSQRSHYLTVFRFPLSPEGRSILMARGTQSRDTFLLTTS